MTTMNFYALTLESREHEYDDVHTFRFRPERKVPFLPGQYVHFLAPASGPGRENVRHLSIASGPDEALLTFSVDLASQTAFKRKLASLQPGEKAHLFKVKGEFVLGTPPPRLVFVAGGLGITPIRSLLSQLRHEHLPVDWRLLHVARRAWLYQKELETWGGTQVRVHREGSLSVLDGWTREWPDARYYVCGSSRFIAGLAEALAARGIPEGNVRVEDFE